MPDDARRDLDSALKTFERVASTLQKAERVWAELAGGGLTSEEHDGRIYVYMDLIGALPAIDGLRVQAVPMSQSDMQLERWDANQIGEPEFHVQTEERIHEPGTELQTYRHAFDRARREIVRGRIDDVVHATDAVIAEMTAGRDNAGRATADQWKLLDRHVAELDRLLGDSTARPARWSDLRRHLHFGESVDLNDILDLDWPSVKEDLEHFIYDEFEPMPVDVDDLDALVTARPRGRVSTALRWANLGPDSFERLLFELVGNETGYENPDWLMKTNAADQGRDVQAYRVTVDSLSGTRRERVIIQCKHWQGKTIGRDDIVLCVEAVQLWEPPRVDVLIIATSGRFSKDAVAWSEKREVDRTVPRVELWPDSHLEMLLARRPYLTATFGLR